MSIVYKTTDYLRSSRLELKHVKWPSKKEVIRSTLLVIGVSAFFTIFLGLLDILFGLVLSRFII